MLMAEHNKFGFPRGRRLWKLIGVACGVALIIIVIYDVVMPEPPIFRKMQINELITRVIKSGKTCASAHGGAWPAAASALRSEGGLSDADFRHMVDARSIMMQLEPPCVDVASTYFNYVPQAEPYKTQFKNVVAFSNADPTGKRIVLFRDGTMDRMECKALMGLLVPLDASAGNSHSRK
jgi:hypothetical protein